MVAENIATQARIDRGLDDTTVEQVAREQYGMRRPGETVYRVLDRRQRRPVERRPVCRNG